MINVIGRNGEKLPHGISKMSGNKKVVDFKGFYYGNFFIVQSVVNNGENTYKVIDYEEVYSVPMDKEYTELISFIRIKEGYDIDSDEAFNVEVANY